MFPITSGATQAYLASLEANQQQMQQTQSQLSSGIRVEQPSDDPGAIAEILQLQSEIGQNQQVQSNLGSVTTQLDTADSALQTAVQALESAISLGTEGASSTASADQRSNLAEQVSGVLQTLVQISCTQDNGIYLFGGDQATQAPYRLDPTQPNGVQQLAPTASTLQIVDASGASIPVAEGAQQIFDARNADGSPASGNVFAAVNSLLTALQNNDSTGISNSLAQLQTANTYLNEQLAFYGNAEDQIATAANLAQKFQVQQQSDLSQTRDADMASLATQLTEEQVRQEASLTVESTLLQNKNLFSYLA